MIRSCLLFFVALIGPLRLAAPAENRPLLKSAFFAYADRDYIFTIEVVKPGVPLLNFVSMTDADISLPAKNIRLALENRKVAGKVFAIEAGDFQQPMVITALTIHPRSSFGVRINGDFGDAQELFGAAIRLGAEDFKLVPLTKFDFESLVLKVNRLNLGSPDFSEDWRVLRLEPLGSRSPVSRR
jgi:hypothetical protein